MRNLKDMWENAINRRDYKEKDKLQIEWNCKIQRPFCIKIDYSGIVTREKKFDVSDYTPLELIEVLYL